MCSQSKANLLFSKTSNNCLYNTIFLFFIGFLILCQLRYFFFFFFLSQGLSFQTLFTVVQQTILMNAQLLWRGQQFPLLVSQSVP